jgi:hypothetical protein
MTVLKIGTSTFPKEILRRCSRNSRVVFVVQRIERHLIDGGRFNLSNISPVAKKQARKGITCA